jgi:lipoprotein-releasing system permease protein
MIGVCVGSAALVIVLSVFNGLEQLNRQIFEVSNPDLSILPIEGKTFENDSLLLSRIKSFQNVDFTIETIEDNALGRQEEDQLIIVLKGVDDNFKKLSKLKDAVVDGQLYVSNENGNFAFVGAGVYNFLNLSVLNVLSQLEIWYPKNEKLSVLNPEENINRLKLPVSGVFALEQQYDNYVYISLNLAETLTGKYGQRSAYELYLKKGSNIDKLKDELNAILPSNLIAKNRDELNEALFKAIRIEKLFIFIALLFIIGIASFNIFFSLSMLVLDKKDDIQTLSAMGASSATVRNIFLKEGFIIAGIGSILGILLGCIICLSQMYFGWLSMGMENAIVDAYPVALKIGDVVISFLGIIVITLFAAFFPAQKATTFMK